MISTNIYAKKSFKFFILFALFLAGLFTYPLAILGYDFSFMPGDLGDARFINYILEHGYQFVSGNRDSFYNAPFFFPAKNVLALSDNMIGHLPVYSFFRVIHFSREESLQLWWLSLFALNYFISFFCFYRYSNNFLASVIVAYLFTFSILNLAQLNYLQINAKFLLPVMFLYYFKWLSTKEAKNLNVFLLVFFMQILLSLYYAIFMVVFIVTISIIHMIISKNMSPFKDVFFNFKKYRLSIILLLIVIAGALLYLTPYIKASETFEMRTYNHVKDAVPEWHTFLNTSPSTIWVNIFGDGSKYFPGNYWMHQYFPGVFPFLIILSLVLMVIIKPAFILSYKSKLVLTAFIIMFFISIKWWNEFSPLQFFYGIKLFGPITLISRMIFVVDVLFLFVTLNFLTKMFSNNNKYVVFGIFIFVVSFILIDNHISDPAAVARTKKSDILARYEKIKKVINNIELKDRKILALLEEDRAKSDVSLLLDAMLVSQELNFASINGYSSTAPANANFFWMLPTRNELYKWCGINNLDSLDVIIINSPNSKSK